MHPASLQIKDFTYDLPEDKIARYPLPQRDSSRLLICRNHYLTEDIYKNISLHIPQKSLLIFNQTKVIHARLLFKKETGAKIEVFCLEPDERYADVQTAMLQRKEVFWKCMIGGAAKWKEAQVLSLHVEPKEGLEEPLQLFATIVERKEGTFTLKIYWDQDLSFAEALHYAGRVPLPPYLNRVAEQSDEQRYQTIFAKEEGSVAAPTAALHFTQNTVASLAKKEIDTGFVTLHVGAGTFKPVKSVTMQEHDMHAEWLEVTPQLIEQLLVKIEAGLPVIAIGTTSARTLESLYWIGVQLIRKTLGDMSGIAVPQWYPYESDSDISAMDALQTILIYLEQQKLQRLVTRTRIIIAPGYRFRIVKALVTNFHQPQSTLLLLVSALIGDTWRFVYEYALQHDFRFLSYGDGCLLWGKEQCVPDQK